MYKLRGVEKFYKKRGISRTALKRVDFDLPAIGLFAVVGESGSGKSTLLHMLAGLVAPDKGTVEIGGHDVSKPGDAQRSSFVARDVGFAFQEDELIAHASLGENMRASLILAGFPKREAAERADAALERAGLGEFGKCLPEQLSKHQLRRFSFARAMCKDAKVVLLDEPEVGLAEKERESLIRELEDASVGALVVVATRDAAFAEALGAEVITIEDGVVDHTGGEVAASHDTAAPASDGSVGTSTAPAQKPRAVSVPFTAKLGFVRASLRNRSGRSIVLGLSAMLGIVALAFVLTVSKGITTYIDTDNRDTLSQQPLQVGTLAFNSKELEDALTGDGSTQLSASELITKTIRSAKNNDLKSFKSHIEDNKDKFSSCTEMIDYDYGVTPQVFVADTSAGTVSLKTSSVAELSSSYTASFTSPAGFTTMARLDAKTDNYTSNYDVLQGRWPESYNELVLVLPSDRSVPGLDLTSNSVEARLQRLNDTIAMFKTGKLSDDKTVESFTFSLQEYMDLDLKLVSVAECYTQNEGGGSWQNNSSDEDFMKNIIANSENLKIVGVVAPSENAASETLSAGLWYLPSLENRIAERAGASDIVKAQKANPDVDVFTGIRFDSKGRSFDDLARSVSSSINAALSSIEGQLSAALEQTFADIEKELGSLALDEGFELDFTDADDAGEDGDEDENGGDVQDDEGAIGIDWEGILGTTSEDSTIVVDVDEDAIDEALLDACGDYLADALSKGQTPTREGLVDYLARKDVSEKLNKKIDEAFTTVKLDEETKKQFEAFVEQEVVPYLLERVEEEYGAYIAYIEAQIKAGTYEPLKELEETFAKLNSEDAFASLGLDTAFNDFFKEFDLSGAYDELNSILALDEEADGEAADGEEAGDSADEGAGDETSGRMDARTKKFLDSMVKMATTTLNTYDLNMKALGYSDFSTPSTIRFYTPTYEDRVALNKLIGSYNDSVGAAGTSSKHIDYYDLVDTVTNISMDIIKLVSLISVVLLLLTGIVTTLTVGAITFFSSRDRWRETSVMRVLGATRRTVFSTLVLEGALIGLLSAAVGLAATALLSMPINSSAMADAGFAIMVFEPWHVALLLALGVVSMLVGYLVPAIAISRKDAVSVLRAR